MRYVKTLMQIGCVLLLPFVQGCGGPRGATMEGQVRYAGEPVEDGVLTLVPLGRTVGGEVQTPIKNGKYSFGNEDGLVAGGRYRIEIRASRKIGPVPSPADGISETESTEEFPQEFISEEYNDRSTIETTLKSGMNSHHFDFSRAKWERKRE